MSSLGGNGYSAHEVFGRKLGCTPVGCIFVFAGVSRGVQSVVTKFCVFSSRVWDFFLLCSARGYTYDDLILLPGHIDFSVEDISLHTKLTKNISLKHVTCEWLFVGGHVG